MDFPLGQLIYTSFPGIGFRTLVSAQVPTEVQQVFIQRVVSQYWDSYNPPPSGYRAVYLHQVTLEDCLFGWLYNDGADDIGRTHLPYFICYYLAEPLQTVQLENVFTFLYRGPVALIDRQNSPSSLETIVAPNLWNYQPARSGVAIPSVVNVRSHIALKRGERLDLFVSVNEQETAIELEAETYEQQAAELSIYTRYLIEAIETGVVDLVDLEDEPIIKDRVIKPYQEYKKRLQLYEQALVEVIQHEYPINYNTRNSLKGFQQSLQLIDKDVELIEARIAQQTKVAQRQELITGAIKGNEAVAVNAVNTYSSIRTALPHILSTLLSFNIGTHRNSILAYRNSQLLLKVGIAATVLALFGSIYGLLETSVFAPSKFEFISSASSPIFYKTFAEVPNVPQGLFNYGGFTIAPLQSIAVASAINQAQPQFQLLFTKPIEGNSSSGTGIKMLLAGELSFAQSSQPVTDTEFTQAKERGFTLEQVPVAIDGIAFYVNPQVSIPGLSLSQVRDIFTGKIRNWKALGGADLPITLFGSNPQSGGSVDVLKEKVLAEEFSTTVQEAESTTASIREVARTPGGISYDSTSVVAGQHTIHVLSLSREVGQNFVSPFSGANGTTVNKTAFANGSYPLTRRLFVIIKRDSRIDEQVGSAYVNLLLTDEGQRLLEQVGFVSIRGCSANTC